MSVVDETILVSSRDAFIMIDYSGRIIFWNNAATRIFGYTADEALNKDLYELIVPKQSKDKYKQVFQVLESIGSCTVNSHSLEWPAIRKDQREISVELFLSPMMIENKWYAVGILRDISARKRDLRLENKELQSRVVELTREFSRVSLKLEAVNNELELANQKLNLASREQEREVKCRRVEHELLIKKVELNQFFSLTLDLICFLDKQGKFFKVNRAFELTLGYSADEMTSRSFLDFVHPHDVESTKDIFARNSNGLITNGFCNRYRCKNGEYRWFEWTGLRDEKTGVCFGTARDITERKKVEDELREKNKEVISAKKKAEASWLHLNNVIGNIDGIIWNIDRNGVFTLYEGQVLKKTALKPGQYIGLSIFEVYNDAPEILKAMKSALKGIPCQIETKYQNLMIRLSCTPLLDSCGNVNGVVGSAADITKRRDWERRLKIMQENHQRSNAFNDILAGSHSEKEQNRRLSKYGIDCRKPVTCYLIAIIPESMAIEDLENSQEGLMEWLVENGYFWNWDNHQSIGVLIQNRASILANRDEQKAKAQELLKKLERDFPNGLVRIGIATTENEVLNLKRLYYRAYGALLLSFEDKKQSNVFHYKDCGIYQVLPFVMEHMNVEDFINQFLGRLIQYDQDKGGDLLPTLAAILTYPNLKTVAAEMHIHHNTVLWRKNKVEEILGYAIDDANKKLHLAVAIKLKSILKVMSRNL